MTGETRSGRSFGDIFNPDEELYKLHVVFVHLDLAPDATCISFVYSLKRFLGRYGVAKLFSSVNATCFVGQGLTFVSNGSILSGNSSWKQPHGGEASGRDYLKIRKGIYEKNLAS